MTPRPLSSEPSARIEELEAKIAQAYQIIATLLTGPEGTAPAFDSEAGQAILSYFSREFYDADLLPWPRDVVDSGGVEMK